MDFITKCKFKHRLRNIFEPRIIGSCCRIFDVDFTLTAEDGFSYNWNVQIFPWNYFQWLHKVPKGKKIYGLCVFVPRTIQLAYDYDKDKNQDMKSFKNTIYHELVHAMTYEYTLRLQANGYIKAKRKGSKYKESSEMVVNMITSYKSNIQDMADDLFDKIIEEYEMQVIRRYY